MPTRTWENLFPNINARVLLREDDQEVIDVLDALQEQFPVNQQDTWSSWSVRCYSKLTNSWPQGLTYISQDEVSQRIIDLAVDSGDESDYIPW